MRNLKHYLLSTGVILAGSVFCADTSYAAPLAYGYAQQTLSGVTVSGTGLTNGTQTGNSTTASAVMGGLGPSSNAPTDTLEAYTGASPAAPQNDFTKYSTNGGGPQAGDFTRGDAVINSLVLFTTGASASVVAESSTSDPLNGLSTGQATWTLSGTFQSTGPSVMISYSYSNDIITLVAGPGSQAQAQYGASISIKDQHGHEVDATPTELSSALSAPPNGPEIATSGNSSVTMNLAGLTPGDTYSLTITGQTSTSAIVPDLTSTPEPTTLGLLGAGIVALALRRRS